MTDPTDPRIEAAARYLFADAMTERGTDFVWETVVGEARDGWLGHAEAVLAAADAVDPVRGELAGTRNVQASAKADALREAADALEGMSLIPGEPWWQGVLEWLRARSDAIEEAAGH